MLPRKARNVDFVKTRLVLVLSERIGNKISSSCEIALSELHQCSVRILSGRLHSGAVSNLIFTHFPICGAGTNYAEISAL